LIFIPLPRNNLWSFSLPSFVLFTTQEDRLKEKTPACAAGAAGRCAITQSQDRLDLPAATRAAQVGALTGDCVMDDHYSPSVFSLNT
jgi:hypothetical protein